MSLTAAPVAQAASRFTAIEARIEALATGPVAAGMTASHAAAELLRLGEEVMEIWIAARGQTPTHETREGFRLLALHRQGAKGEPSFNACRETCRELVYHYNLIAAVSSPGVDRTPDVVATAQPLRLMALVAKHICLFVEGKMQVDGLGEFCCAAKPVRANGQ